MTGQRTATPVSSGAIGGVVAGLLVTLGAAAVVLVPWRGPAAPPQGATPVDPARDFTAAEMAREDAFHTALWPWAYGSLLLGVAVACFLGFTPWGARIVSAIGKGVGERWLVAALIGGALVAVIPRLVTAPLDAGRETVLRHYGLSIRSWSTWAADQAKGALVTAVVGAITVVVVVGLARAAPRWWWAVGAGVAAVLVVVGSLVWPVLVEPLFLTATPMPQGELRTSILDMAERDGVPLDDVLVADASTRTTALNAYVSGIGPTRRLVLYDTLIETAPKNEVELVAAHELGHAARGDVWRGTILGALGAAAGVALLGLLLRDGGLLVRRAGASGAADPRVTALVLALVALASLLFSPAGSLVSRQIEAAADRHALDLTSDPATAVSMHRRLAVQNLSDLDPPAILYVWFASHPTAPERIAAARDWALTHGVQPP